MEIYVGFPDRSGYNTYVGPDLSYDISDDNFLTIMNWVNPETKVKGTSHFPPGQWSYCTEIHSTEEPPEPAPASPEEPA